MTQTRSWCIRALTVVLAVSMLIVTASPVAAQTVKARERGVAAGGDVTVHAEPGGAAVIQTGDGTVIIKNIQGIDPETYEALAKKYGVTETAVEGFFRIIEREQVPLAALDKTLRDIAENYKALLVQVRALRGDDPESVRLKDEAETALQVGDLDQAEVLLKALIAKKRKAREALEAATYTLQMEEAEAQAALGKLKNTQLAYAEAAAAYHQAVALVPADEERTLGRYVTEEGVAWYRAGRYAMAQPVLERARRVYEKALGPEHPDFATSLNNLGGLYKALGRYEEAEPLYKRALAIGEKTLGKDHPKVAIRLNNLGVLYKALGRYEEAEPLYKRALAIGEKTLGKDHPKVAIRLNNLGVLYNDLGRYEEAEPLYKRALAIDEKTLGKDHPTTKTIRDNLTALLRTMGQAQSLAAPATPGGFLGVGLEDVDNGEGARITQVVPDSPAAAVGLQPGDVIVRVGDVPVGDAAELAKRVSMLEPGTAANVTVRRSGHTRMLVVTLGERPNETAKE